VERGHLLEKESENVSLLRENSMLRKERLHGKVNSNSSPSIISACKIGGEAEEEVKILHSPVLLLQQFEALLDWRLIYVIARKRNKLDDC